MAEKESRNDRLDSWKEIAVYLNRTERTVIRWEKTRGLPIHRIPGGQAVFAYRHELDIWLQQGEVTNAVNSTDDDTEARISDGEPIGETELPPDSERFSRNSRINRRAFIWTGSCVVVLLAITLAFLLPHSTASIIRPTRILKLTDDGRYKSNLRTDGRFLYFNETEGNRQVLAAVSIDGGSIRRIPTQFANVDLQDISSNDQYLLGLVPVGIERERPLWYIPLQGGTSGRVGEFTCNLARIAPGKNIIACANGTSISLWDPETNIFRTIGSFGSAVTSFEWSRDSETLRFSLQDGISSALSPWELTLPNDKAAHVLPRRLSLGENCCSSWTWLNGYRDFAYLRQEDRGRQRLFIRRESPGVVSWAKAERELLIEIGNLELLAPASSPNKL
jgi:hypothetical protein